MTGEKIIVGKRELNVPNDCKGDHFQLAEKIAKRYLGISSLASGGNIVETCCRCRRDVVLTHQEGKGVTSITLS